jgi:hypothetical protein
MKYLVQTFRCSALTFPNTGIQGWMSPVNVPLPLLLQLALQDRDWKPCALCGEKDF